jgi:outer membrane protein TolC
LKVLINDPALDIRGNLLINPTDRPVAEPIALNVAEQIDIALRQRSELQEARLNIEKADITIDVAKNDLLPRFDVTLSTQSTGQDNSFDTAFKNTIDAQKYIDYSAGLKFEIPLGNRQAEAVVKQRNLERRQALTQMLAVAQSVMFDVRNQLRELLTTYQLIQARSSARQAASDQLAALQSRQEIGEKLTPEFLEVRLTAQQTYASAELDELQAMINYNLAIERLEVAKGTLLEYNRVSLAPPPTDPDFGRIRFLGETYGGK